jgi:membrane fusion protein
VQRRLTGEQARLAGARAGAERARLAAVLGGIGQQRSDIQGQVAIQEEVVASAQEMFQRIEGIVAQGFVSRTELERRRQAWLASRQQLAQLRQQLNALGAEERRAQAELGRVAADSGTEINSALSAAETLTQQRARLQGERAYVLTAPIAGRVAALQTAAGRTVDGSMPLLEIVPEGSAMQAQVYAPTRAIGFVRPGQEVRLLYDAFPYQRFGSFSGRIVSVSRVVIDPRQLAAPLQIEEPVYRVEVAPDAQAVAAFGDRVALQPGMTLTANIVLERRSFLDWLLAPVRAVLRRNG